MNITPRKSRKIVNNFLKSKLPIQGEMLIDVAQRLRRQRRAGDVRLMETFLQKALRGNRLFEFEESGQTFYESKPARQKRMRAAKKLQSTQASVGSDAASVIA